MPRRSSERSAVALRESRGTSSRRRPTPVPRSRLAAGHYYDRSDAGDLVARGPDVLAEAVAHWRLAARRPPGTARSASPLHHGARVRPPAPHRRRRGRGRHAVPGRFGARRLNRHGFLVDFVVHPIVAVTRTDDGLLVDARIASTSAPGVGRESSLHFEVDQRCDPTRLAGIKVNPHILEDVEEPRRSPTGDRSPSTRSSGCVSWRVPASVTPAETRGRLVPALARRRPLHVPGILQYRPGCRGGRRCCSAWCRGRRFGIQQAGEAPSPTGAGSP